MEKEKKKADSENKERHYLVSSFKQWGKRLNPGLLSNPQCVTNDSVLLKARLSLIRTTGSSTQRRRGVEWGKMERQSRAARGLSSALISYCTYNSKAASYDGDPSKFLSCSPAPSPTAPPFPVHERGLEAIHIFLFICTCGYALVLLKVS